MLQLYCSRTASEDTTAGTQNVDEKSVAVPPTEPANLQEAIEMVEQVLPVEDGKTSGVKYVEQTVNNGVIPITYVVPEGTQQPGTQPPAAPPVANPVGTPPPAIPQDQSCPVVRPLTPQQQREAELDQKLAPLNDTFGISEEGNARRFAVYYKGLARYCHERKRWYLWKGRRWEPDMTGRVLTMASNMLRTLGAAIKKVPVRKVDGKNVIPDAVRLGRDPQETYEKLMTLAKFFAQQQSVRGLGNMLKLAQDHMAVSAAEFDGEIWALNVANGTIDLKADRGCGQYCVHNPEMLITKLVDVHYDPEASFPAWDRFIRETCAGTIEGKDGPVEKGPVLERFLQKAVGMSLTGHVREKAMYLAHGDKDSGKSTLIEATQGITGDYGVTASFDTFIQKRDAGGPTPGLAALVGVRFVACDETDPGRRLAAGLLKGLIGGGSEITCRFLHENPISFTPQCKLWLICNHRPQVDADDSAMWSRINVIPLDNTVPEERQDKTLRDQFATPEARARILAWAIEGCLMWQREGLNPPECVRIAQEDYREAQDRLAEFLEERCTVAENATCTFNQLYTAYLKWVEDTYEKYPLGKKKFSQELAAKGIQRVRLYVGDKQVRCLQGVSVMREWAYSLPDKH